MKSVVFITEKIWGQSPQKADDARLKLKEAGTEEGQIVFVQQVIIPSESDFVSFTDASCTEADATHRTVRVVPKDLPRKNDIVNALKMNDFVIDESEKQLDENDEVYCIPVGVKEPAGRPAGEFRASLEQLSEVCVKRKIETVSFYVLDFRLASVDFTVAYGYILSLLVQQG